MSVINAGKHISFVIKSLSCNSTLVKLHLTNHCGNHYGNFATMAVAIMCLANVNMMAHQYLYFCPGVSALVVSTATLMPSICSCSLTPSADAMTVSFSSALLFQKIGTMITFKHKVRFPSTRAWNIFSGMMRVLRHNAPKCMSLLHELRTKIHTADEPQRICIPADPHLGVLQILVAGLVFAHAVVDCCACQHCAVCQLHACLTVCLSLLWKQPSLPSEACTPCLLTSA